MLRDRDSSLCLYRGSSTLCVCLRVCAPLYVYERQGDRKESDIETAKTVLPPDRWDRLYQMVTKCKSSRNNREVLWRAVVRGQDNVQIGRGFMRNLSAISGIYVWSLESEGFTQNLYQEVLSASEKTWCVCVCVVSYPSSQCVCVCVCVWPLIISAICCMWTPLVRQVNFTDARWEDAAICMTPRKKTRLQKKNNCVVIDRNKGNKQYTKDSKVIFPIVFHVFWNIVFLPVPLFSLSRTLLLTHTHTHTHIYT